jgi:hypothetical protein
VTTPTDATNSTTTPPRRPTGADVALLGFAQSVEITARDLYRQAIEAGSGDDHVASLVAMAAHHDAYAQSISATIGAAAPQARNEELFQSLTQRFGRNTSQTALAAHELENRLVVTHRSLLANLDGTEGSALVASILITEARHAVALATIAGLSPVTNTDAFLVTTDLAPLSPASPA